MVSYYNPLGMYQKGGGAACGHGGWYQPPLLEDGVGWAPPAPWQGGEWAPPPRAPSASASPAPRTSPGPRAPPPAPSRSPYEWMKKPSYQSQPNPGDCRSLFVWWSLVHVVGKFGKFRFGGFLYMLTVLW